MLKRVFSTSSKAMSLINVTKAVEASMQRLYPLALADQSWDNVGLLLEPPFPRRHSTPTKPKVLLTIDLTTKVAQEALLEKSGVETIVTYHPIIFRGLKSLTLQDPQQQSLLKLCAQGVGVYSPHTSIDGAVGGVNDWLASVVTQGESAEISPILPCNNVEGHENGGHGRVVSLNTAIPVSELIKRIKKELDLQYLQYAAPDPGIGVVKTVAICAGSGGSVFKALSDTVDLLFTGELSHHEVLAAVAKGQHVILCGHTNTERGFLKTLQRTLQTNLDEYTLQGEIEVIISKQDHDPLQII